MNCLQRIRLMFIFIVLWLAVANLWGRSYILTDNVSSLSQKAVLQPLAVLSFSSSIIDDSIDLTYLVRMLNSVDSVEIQRSAGGSRFETVDKVKGTAIDSVTFEFSYRDENVLERYYYYRLKYQSNENSVYFTEPVKVNAIQAKRSVLEQNTPNPFNPSTTIRFEIKERSKVNLRIYNTLGQNICTLIDSHLEPGRYILDWDGKDDFGRDLAGGVYFYQILIDRYFETRRMTLLR